MQNDIKKKKRVAPILCAAIMITILLVYIMTFLYPVLGAEIGDGVAIAMLAVCALALVAVIVGVILALRQRLQEINGGEEEDAKKY